MKTRYLANCEAYKYFGYTYGKNYPKNLVPRPGAIIINMRNPKNSECAKEYEGFFIEPGASVKMKDDNLWRIAFREHLQEFAWMSALWTKVYGRIKPMLRIVFEADITISVEWEFED